jgi:hypothetical protein
MASLAAARAAKESLRQQLVGQPWFRGIGITQSKCMGPDPYELQVNVAARADLSRVYRSWNGVPVSIAVVGNITPLGVTVTAQDYSNVFIGFAVLFGTFMIGKIAVESIVAARREHFDSKGQPPEAVKAKETAVDGIVKLVAFALSANEIVTEFPSLMTEAKKYLP